MEQTNNGAMQKMAEDLYKNSAGIIDFRDRFSDDSVQQLIPVQTPDPNDDLDDVLPLPTICICGARKVNGELPCGH